MPRMLDVAIKEQDEGDQAVSNMTESSVLSRSWQSRTLNALFICFYLFEESGFA